MIAEEWYQVIATEDSARARGLASSLDALTPEDSSLVESLVNRLRRVLLRVMVEQQTYGDRDDKCPDQHGRDNSRAADGHHLLSIGCKVQRLDRRCPDPAS
jgi:hypothetical protein